ncbi:hypothetical protein D3C87_2055730 [compost metagenome]
MYRFADEPMGQGPLGIGCDSSVTGDVLRERPNKAFISSVSEGDFLNEAYWLTVVCFPAGERVAVSKQPLPVSAA